MVLAETFGEDTIRKFLNAAPLRYEEAATLASEGHNLIAIYLLGYCSEMLLKAAYFKAQRLGLTTEIDRDARNRVMVRARQMGLMSAEPHDLVGWARLLVHDKKTLYLPAYEQRFGQAIIDRSLEIFERWRPQMRYRSTKANSSDVREVREAADWFISNFSKM